MSTVGSVNECREVASTAFANYNGKRKWCEILIEKVHLKPAIMYTDKPLHTK